MVLSQPPFPFFFLAYFCLVPLFYSMRRDGSKADFFFGLKSGIVAYIGLLYWVVIAMTKYGGINLLSSMACMLLLSTYLALYVGAFTYISSLTESVLRIPVYFSAPFFWTLLEYLRTYMLTGFPWSLLAYSQYNFLPFIQICSFAGPYYVSYVIVSINCLLFLLLTRNLKSKAEFFFSVFVTMLVVVTIFYGLIRLISDEEMKSTKIVSVIQASIRQDVKWTDEYKLETLKKHISITLGVPQESNLIVWPETALPFTLEEGGLMVDEFSKFVRILNVPLLVGALSRDETKKLYNSAFLFDSYGKVIGIYRKVHLVPFGEYTPLIEYFPFLEKISVAGEDFSPGKSHEPLLLPGFGRIGVLICYEGIFPQISRKTVIEGAEILINLTNDAWYDRSSAPYQHFAFYIFRAIETDRFVVRSANTGISAVIDPKGRVISKTSLFTEEILTSKISLRKGETFYVKYGDWFIALVAFALFITVAFRSLSHKYLWK
ncbi:MAG: apolipoprotein N-acyltransferase [Desulfobacterota bacterium]|nr:apolipoprotein N-acyltransferase [Thermodesulfobacteriota bacterium]MDW8002637.1 apolipoprotein N-acyltransferase [Deltaproteobacteria bacterium]